MQRIAGRPGSVWRQVCHSREAQLEDWKEVVTQEDADALLGRFGWFHDGCIREAHFWGGHWVGEGLVMRVPWDPRDSLKVRMPVQRQFKDPSAMEMVFTAVLRWNLVSPGNSDAMIFGATLLVRDGVVYSSAAELWEPVIPVADHRLWVGAERIAPGVAYRGSAETGADTRIAARRLFWRDVDWMGGEPRYGRAGAVAPGQSDRSDGAPGELTGGGAGP